MAKLANGINKKRKRAKRGKPLSLPELFDLFPDDYAAERWFEKLRWGTSGIITCPRCLSWATKETPNREPLAYWCKGCRRHFNVRTNSVMVHTKLGYRVWALAIHAFVAHPEGGLQYPDAPGPQDHPEDRLVSEPPDPRGVVRRGLR